MNDGVQHRKIAESIEMQNRAIRASQKTTTEIAA